MIRFHNQKRRASCPLVSALLIIALTGCCLIGSASPISGEGEYYGKLDGELVPNTEDLDQIIFKPVRDLSKIKFATKLDDGDKVTAGRLYDPLLDKSAILTLLVEPEDGAPFLYADLNHDNVMEENERFELTREEEDNPYILQTTLLLPLKASMFKNCPVYVQYLKNVQWDEMREGERMVLQSKEVFAKGSVDIQGHKTLVQYGFNPKARKITVTNGLVGVDCDGDGQVDIDRFSPESAEARDETVVFHVGEHYVSTRRVDVEKNQIIMREHPASDYKRVELNVGSEIPDFSFTDFHGKKRKFSEFRGHYVLLDFWALWCPACRTELPYQKAAYSRFQARGFEILGMNNDEDTTPIKPWLEKNGLTWPQATMDSIRELEIRYRIHLFPSTILVGPDGKIISLDQHKKNQPPLRGRELLKTLDELLPP